MFKIGITGQFLYQLQTHWNWENPEKNRRNLELIQTCDFFMLVNFVENSIERTSACCEFFKISIDFMSYKSYYYSNGYQWQKASGASLIDG